MYFSAIQNSDVYQVMTIETKSVSLDENSSSILSHYVSLCVKYHYGSCKNMIYSKLIFSYQYRMIFHAHYPIGSIVQ